MVAQSEQEKKPNQPDLISVEKDKARRRNPDPTKPIKPPDYDQVARHHERHYPDTPHSPK